jgi:hypothetical protein
VAKQPDGDWSRFGLGNVALPKAAVPRILTQLNWDGESMPYLLLVKFFEDAVQDALDRVELVEPDPDIAELIETGSWFKSGIPEKVIP